MRPAQATERVPGKPGLHSEILAPKQQQQQRQPGRGHTPHTGNLGVWEAEGAELHRLGGGGEQSDPKDDHKKEKKPGGDGARL